MSDVDNLEQIIKQAMAAVLDERRSIDSSEHAKDHEFIHDLRAKANRHTRLIEDTKKQVLGWATIAVLGFFGYSILLHMKTLLVKLINLG